MASVFPVAFMLIVVLVLEACAYYLVPKGPQQITIRTALMLTFACCYLTWAITYLAQLHPLIAPYRSLALES